MIPAALIPVMTRRSKLVVTYDPARDPFVCYPKDEAQTRTWIAGYEAKGFHVDVYNHGEKLPANVRPMGSEPATVRLV